MHYLIVMHFLLNHYFDIRIFRKNITINEKLNVNLILEFFKI